MGNPKSHAVDEEACYHLVFQNMGIQKVMQESMRQTTSHTPDTRHNPNTVCIK